MGAWGSPILRSNVAEMRAGAGGRVLPPRTSRLTTRGSASGSARRMPSKKTSFFSMPMNRRPSAMHASPVLPLPAKGSRTVSPSRLKISTSAAISPAGFCVGWIPPCTMGHSNRLVTERRPSGRLKVRLSECCARMARSAS